MKNKVFYRKIRLPSYHTDKIHIATCYIGIYLIGTLIEQNNYYNNSRVKLTAF